jgi:triosephosphate isomerase (TIM)
MKKPVFAANWKMHLGPQETRAYLQTFLEAYPPTDDRTVIIFPTAISLVVAGFAIRDRSDIMLGIQNIHWEEKGAFTGEHAAPMARDAGAKIVLVGHSERRHTFGEGDEITAKKCAAAFKAGLTVLLCVGEKIEERDRNTTQAVVLRQLKAGISRLTPAQVAQIAVAYEPVWAIGTGRTATPEDATAVHTAIRRALREVVPGKFSEIPILYGGSVTKDNAESLLRAPEVDGLLVGGASLDPQTWAAIART